MLSDPRRRTANPLSPRGWATSIVAAALMVVGAPVVDSGPLQVFSPPRAQAATSDFPCDNTFYVMQENAGGNVLGRIVFPQAGDPGSAEFTEVNHAPGYGWNGMGFNHVDHHIYAVSGGNPARIIRIGANTDTSAYELIGVPVDDENKQWSEKNSLPAGAILPGGRFAVAGGPDFYILNGIQDATQESPPRVNVAAKLHYGDGADSRPVFADLVVNPIDNDLYGFDVTAQRLSHIRTSRDDDPGLVEPAGPVLAASQAGNLFDPNGSAWITGDGRVTLLGERDGNGQDTFLTATFNAGNRQFNALEQIGVEDQLGHGSDGSNCPYRMTLEKNVAPPSVKAGVELDVTYTYTAFNGTQSNQGADFSFEDVLPDDGRTFVDANSSVGGIVDIGPNGHKLTITRIHLDHNATATITATVHVQVPATSQPQPRTIFNQARLTNITSGQVAFDDVLSDFPGNAAHPGRANPADATPLDVTAADADLRVQKTGPNSKPTVGSPFQYTLTVTNDGPGRSQQSTLTDNVPGNLVVEDSSGGGDGNNLSWTVPALDADGTFSKTIRVHATDTGQVENTAVVSPRQEPGDPADPKPGNNSSTVSLTPDPEQAEVSIAKTVQGGGGSNNVRPGAEFTYGISVHKIGGAIPGPVVSDTLPDGLDLVTATAGYQQNGRTISWSLANMDAGTRDVALSITVRVKGDAPSPMRNFATVSFPNGLPPGDNPGNNTSDTVVTTVERQTSLSVTKTVAGLDNPNDVAPGQHFEYRIDVTNSGPDAASTFTVTDQLPGELALDGTPSDGGVADDPQAARPVITWTIQGPFTGPKTLTVPVKARSGSKVTVHNTAVVHPADGTTDTGNHESTVDITVVPRADLSVTKTTTDGAASNRAHTGDVFGYKIVVTNNGPDPAPTSTVTDRIPEGLMPVGFTIGADRVVTLTVTALPPGGTQEFTLTVQVDDTDVGKTVPNTATVNPGPDAVDNPDNNTSGPPVQTTIVPSAEMSITKTLADGTRANTVHPGDTFAYTITVTNGGRNNAPPSTVTDVLPPGVSPAVNPLPGGAAYDPASRTVTWQLATLPAHQSTQLSLPVKADDTDTDSTASNAATVKPGEGVDDDSANNASDPPVVTTIKASADLSVTKTGATQFVEANKPFQWLVTVANAGPSAATNVVVTDLLPAGFGIQDTDGGQASPDGSSVSWTLPTLAAKGERTFTLTVITPNTGSAKNTASVGSNTEDPDGRNNNVEHNVQIRGFTLTKTVQPTGSVRAGDTVTYTITATNQSAVAYTAQDPASFTDDLRQLTDDATIESVTPSAGQIEPGATNAGFTWTGPIPANNGTVTVTVVATVNGPGDQGDNQLVNKVTGGTTCRPDAPGGECSPAPLPVRELTLTKTVDKTVISPGATLTYTVLVENTGRYSFPLLDPAVVTDELKGVLDDATFGTASTDPAGTGLFVPPVAPVTTTLTWTGPLDVGATVKLVYTVTVDNPQTDGDGHLVNLVSSVEDPRCLPEQPCGPPENPSVKAFLLDKSVDKSSTEGVAPAEEVTYTVTVTNSGQVDYTAEDPATFADDLTDVVDDATLVDVATDVGEIELNAGGDHLTWSGALPVADPPGKAGATITVTVRVKNPDLDGNHNLANVVSGSSNCPPPDASPTHGTECTAGDPIPVKGLTAAKVSDAGFVHAGGTIGYTLTVTNTGQVDYTEGDPALVVDDLAGVLDDADYNDDAAATNGEPVAFDATGHTLTWSGPLPKASTITISYSVTVHLPGDGDHSLHNAVLADDSNCPVSPDEGAEPDPACTGGTEDNGGNGDVPIAELKIVKAAAKQVLPGAALGYTVTVTNIGKVDYLAEEPAPTTTETTTTETTTTTAVTQAVVAAEDTTTEKTTTTETTATEEPAPPDKAALGPATWADDLSAVLDDATYGNDAAASAGQVSYAQPILSWTGPVATGATVTINYSVNVNDPMSGDHAMINSIVGPDSNCTCTATTLVVPELAATGSNVRQLVVYGVLMVLFGIGIVFLASRRRRNRNEA